MTLSLPYLYIKEKYLFCKQEPKFCCLGYSIVQQIKVFSQDRPLFYPSTLYLLSPFCQEPTVLRLIHQEESRPQSLIGSGCDIT